MNRNRIQHVDSAATSVGLRRLLVALSGVGLLVTACGGSEQAAEPQPGTKSSVVSIATETSSAVVAQTDADAAQGDCVESFAGLASLCLTGQLNGAAIGPFQTDVFVDSATPAWACSDWVAGKDGRFKLPSFFHDGRTGDRLLGYVMDEIILNYAGPGTYPKTALLGSGSGFNLILGGVSYREELGGTGDVTIESSGDGRITFNDWQSDDGQTATGVLAWTCSDPE
jgi:hypothetical protein